MPHSTRTADEEPTSSEWLTTPQVADMLGVSRWTVRDLRVSGALPYYRYQEKVLRYRTEDVQAFRDRAAVKAAKTSGASGRVTRGAA